MLASLKAKLSPHTKSRLRNYIYLPWIVRDILLCAYWGVRREEGMRLLGVPLVQQSRRGAIEIGKDFKAASLARHNSIGVFQRVTIKALGPSGTIRIGKNVGISGATISSRQSIVIGDNVLIGSGALIADNDAHPLRAEDRDDPSKTSCSPVIIEDGVFIGARAIILKGVKLGSGCVVGAGSVVTRDVPARAVVAGNPAVVVKEI